MAGSLDGAAVVAEARRWLGTPYLHQAARKGIGCDCLGLVRGVWRDLTGQEPAVPQDYPSAWSVIDPSETLLENVRALLLPVEPGCAFEGGQIALFRINRRSAARHMGFLSGPESFIHAYEGACVVESTLSQTWKRSVVARFLLPDPKETL